MNENIIAVNIPNVITIVIIATLGATLLGFATKAIKSKMGGG